MYHHIVFDEELIPTERIPASCDTFDGISFEILVPNGSHVNVGDGLVHFRFYHRFSNAVIGEYILPSELDGFIYGIWGDYGKRYRGSFMFHRLLLMTICPIADDIIQYNYPTFYKIAQDEYTSEKVIHWERVAGLHTSGYTLSSSFVLKLSTPDGAPTAVLRFSKKTCNIRKRDVVAFKFEDGEVVRYPIKRQPVMCDKVLGNYSVDFPLSGKDIQVFTNKGWDSFRVEHENGEPPYVVLNKYRDHYDIPESLDIFKRYAQEYVKALGEMGIALSEPAKEEAQPVQATEEPCFVYLMVDTTNGYHKIGISNHPEYRERTLQSEKPTIEKVCAKQFPSRQIAIAIESALHSTFSLKRIRGEWFNLTAEDVAQVIETLK